MSGAGVRHRGAQSQSQASQQQHYVDDQNHGHGAPPQQHYAQYQQQQQQQQLQQQQQQQPSHLMSFQAYQHQQQQLQHQPPQHQHQHPLSHQQHQNQHYDALDASDARMARARASILSAGPSKRRQSVSWKDALRGKGDDGRVLFFVLLTIASFVTRYYYISQPTSVAWDETHFGKFANGYIKGEFFFDVHPPLAKMMIGFAGAVTGYRGDFEFKNPGQAYEQTPYLGMRMFCAFFGALIIPLVYGTILDLGFSPTAGLIAGSLVLFETGTVALSRLILLDPIMMFFIQASLFCTVRFFLYRDEPFSDMWWFWMFLSGVSIACAFSVKWVGLFIILFVGLTTAKDLWDLLGDLSLTKTILGKHLLARAVCLIVIPAIIYSFFFAIHFAVLTNSGPGDGFMSSRFQTTLKGNELNNYNGPREIAYGSIVSLKNHRSGGALLHSHTHTYPEAHGPQQQQVTCYSHKDSNNHWLIKHPGTPDLNAESEKAMVEKTNVAPLEYIKHGSIVRLEHINTKRNIHSHREKAPLTTRHFQVSGYGADGVGDANDHWRVEVLDGGGEDNRVQTLITRFRLIHVSVGCALHSHGKNLPKWGWEQLEVTCNPNVNDADNMWNIEMHQNDRLPKVEGVSYRPSFISNLIEIHVAMAQVNNGLKPKENEITSRPWQWPINYRGQRFTGWGDNDTRIYLLGNPVIFWGCLVMTVVFILFYAVDAGISQRGYREPPWNRERKAKLLATCAWLLIGWAMHYFPFFVMGRILYFHHYFPALLFSCMYSALLLDYFIMRLRMWTMSPRVTIIGTSILLLIMFASFLFFAPVSYGMTGPVNSFFNRRWMESWEFS
ncbi:protein-O-mannosyltransferase 2 [Capsaspora owczarzaki ATCC 30864]|uniref:dolichyl-phosphate-mannose--protein mannosyltransferase n=1 Tax=Capsaspora owczarzaki (strain ATCC 30864) TaxID=595528 RepID=A0A0D2WM45_CAPO3|nr:protein-O-mannosyltransferase 2 [Capsaspora owczarzaki ATCC 30864]KJE91845.1 protein-O-mannosyltransferase 2 [Capsaspora owczarzaki ATCC 30864]|eukprot:XP_004363760.2 protein-O-mannosyltransferase 2 [Capsaspora owczarzaki ATCC 30864]